MEKSLTNVQIITYGKVIEFTSQKAVMSQNGLATYHTTEGEMVTVNPHNVVIIEKILPVVTVAAENVELNNTEVSGNG